MIMLPYSLASFILLILWALLQKNQPISINFSTDFKITQKKESVVYFALFVICILTIAKILDYRIMLLIVLAVLILTDPKILFKVDYSLLLTFTSLFVFIGNMGRTHSFSSYIKAVIDSHECITAILASQIISNVPAALLLSGFTDNIKELIVGVNLEGLA